MASASNATVVYLNEHPISTAAHRRAQSRADALHRHPAGRARQAADVRSADATNVIDLASAIHAKRGTTPEPNELGRQVAALTKFIRRRITGEYTVDEFGFDPHLTDAVTLPMLRALFKVWFRVEVSGIENLPAAGGALVVANHAGMLPIDTLMAAVAVHEAHPARRALRVLADDMVLKTPLVGPAARKTGQTAASPTDAHRLLSNGELTAVFPEGYHGPGKRFADRYKLQPFTSDGFVSAALRTNAPIIPCSIVGSEEIYPIIGELKPLARLLKLPYFPITPLFPLAGLAGLIPLPSKWHIEFGAPIATTEFDDSAAADPAVTLELTDQVRDAIQQTLHRLQATRRNTFVD